MNIATATQPYSNGHAPMAHNPFAGNASASGASVTRPSSNVMADVSQQRETAEVQAAMVIAKKFPRDPIDAMDRILHACTRATLAESALYSYSRGGSDITGPSIRLAEVAAQCWGNVQFGIRELEQRNGESTVEAYAWDIETNTRQVKVFQVPHVRHTKRGAYRLEDPRDIYELTANQGARRLRACILGVIPGDVIEAAVKQCEVTLTASADTSPEALKKMLAAFEPFGVTREQIEKRIQYRLEAIRPAQVVMLKKIYTSLRDGMSTPPDWFEPLQAADGESASADQGGQSPTLRDKVRARGQQGKTAAQPAAVPEPPAPQAQEQVHTAFDIAPVLDDIQACTDVDALDLIADGLRDLPEGEARTQLEAAYRDRRAALSA